MEKKEIDVYFDVHVFKEYKIIDKLQFLRQGTKPYVLHWITYTLSQYFQEEKFLVQIRQQLDDITFFIHEAIEITDKFPTENVSASWPEHGVVNCILCLQRQESFVIHFRDNMTVLTAVETLTTIMRSIEKWSNYTTRLELMAVERIAETTLKYDD